MHHLPLMGGKAGKYARFEFERRFLVERCPEGVAGDDGWRIADRYVSGTRLRLRRMEPLGVGETVLKLGQKTVPAPPDFSRMTITNIYLTSDEYEVLAALPAQEVRKSRYRLHWDGHVYALDVFEAPLEGLILAEVAFETIGEMERHELPAFALRDVSNDVRFTGGALAALTHREARELLSKVRGER